MSKSIFFCIILFYSFLSINSNPSNALSKFIEAHPNNSSVFIIEDGEHLIDYRSSITFPTLFSTKIIIAAIYADLISKKEIEPNEIIDLKPIRTLNNYVESNKDLEKWLVINESTNLSNLINAMINFDSNSIEEFLIGKIGLTKINSIANSLNFNYENKIIPPIALQLALSNNRYYDKGAHPEINKSILSIHDNLKSGHNTYLSKHNSKLVDVPSLYQPRFNAKEYSLFLDKVLSDQVANVTFHNIMNSFLTKSFKDPNGLENQDNELLLIQSETVQDDFKYIVYRHESTNDKRYVCCFYFNDLTPKEIKKLKKYTNDIANNLNNGGKIIDIIPDLSHTNID